MMELSLLKDIVVIFALSTGVNIIFTRLRIPTIVGYLLTGIIAGPYLLSLIDAKHEIELMAEIGVALLLFTVGLEFSLKHLLKIRKIVFAGGFLQVVITAGTFYLLSFLFNIDWKISLFMGFLAALSSSALVLKLLQERSELSSNYGRTVLGILIFQDILLVPLLLFANILGNDAVNLSEELLTLLVKAIAIIGLVYVGNKWLLPRLLHLIAMAKNQELFMMSIFLICFSIALLTSSLGMSLAFGAFLAGLMISESEYSYNVFGNLIPVKDTFTSFFFVSIGMLLDLSFLTDNYLLVIASVLLVIFLKAIIAGGVGFILGHTLRGTVLVGLALSQVGEFSFILAKIGFTNQILPNFYYQLFLAVAVITMGLTPFSMKYSHSFANLLLKLPLPNFLVQGLFPLGEIELPHMKNHLVIIGKDPSALKLSNMAKKYNQSHVAVVFDPAIAREKIKAGDVVIYGDAVNEPILHKAQVEVADIVVVSVGDLIPAMAIIEKVRKLNKDVYILVRAKYTRNVEQLYKVGADQVLPEKLEIAIDLFNRVLIKRDLPRDEISRILMQLRNVHLGEFMKKDTANQPTIFDEFLQVNISATTVEPHSKADGKSIGQLDLRKNSGVTVLAVKKDEIIIEHPTPETLLEGNDIAFIMGKPKHINIATTELFSR
jgi:CPA2 family monovalent cation:H+ antiporter-2